MIILTMFMELNLLFIRKTARELFDFGNVYFCTEVDEDSKNK